MTYPSDLNEKEWELIKHHFEPRDRRGSACIHPRKRIIAGILYIVRTGAQWRQLPRDFPPWKTVYHHFSRWNKAGVWEAALRQLNARHRKKTAGRGSRVTASSIRKVSKPSTTVTHAALMAARR